MPYEITNNDTVDVTSLLGEEHTWKTYPAAWKDFKKSWRAPKPITTTVQRQSFVCIDDKASKEFINNNVSCFGIGELFDKDVCKNFNERVPVLELLSKQISRSFFNTLVIFEQEQNKAQFWRRFFTGFSTVDSSQKEITTNASEQLLIDDIKYQKLMHKNYSALLKLQDIFGRTFISNRKFLEDVEAIEQCGKAAETIKRDEFTLFDAYIKNCEAVLSDVSISKNIVSDQNDFWDIVNAPSNFTKFTDFKVGEYEYEEALVRLIIKTESYGLTPTVADVVMHVDIPDTDDRGRVEITDTAAPTIVHFNKRYYTAPEVSVVVAGGTTDEGVIIPYIVSTDKYDDAGRYFEVELRNAAGNRTTGVISWVSKGY